MVETPQIKKYRVPLFSKDFRYLKSDDEVRRFLIAAKDVGTLSWALYATALYTGMRQGELAGLQWSDIDFDRRLITVQRSFTGLTKGGEVRYVPILDALAPILRAWRLQCQNTLVFPNEAGKMQLKCARIFDEIFHRTLEAAGFSKITISGRLRSYIRFHDLRHTFASHWVMKGCDIFKLQKILGHKSIQMRMRYAHLCPSAFASDHKIFDNLNPPQKPAKILKINA